MGLPIVSGGKRLQLNSALEAMAYALTDVINGNTRRLIITVPRSLSDLLVCCSVAFALGMIHDEGSFA